MPSTRRKKAYGTKRQILRSSEKVIGIPGGTQGAAAKPVSFNFLLGHFAKQHGLIYIALQADSDTIFILILFSVNSGKLTSSHYLNV